jgi:very-short-patch-repair endonuclease
MSLPKNQNLTPVAKRLRREMTKQEKHLWYDFLRNFKYQFNRQKVIGRYIVDFYCHSARLVVEIDGGQHFEDSNLQKDNIRMRVLESYGLHIFRFTNNEVDQNFYEVCMAIQEQVELLVGLSDDV